MLFVPPSSPTILAYDTGVSFGNGPVTFQLNLVDLTGYTDCSAGGFCDVDWEITAGIRFEDGGTLPSGSCDTDEFTIEIAGDSGGVDSSLFTIPTLGGTGTQYCGDFFSLASAMNSLFGLGSNAATLSLYKFGMWDAFNNPLYGSP